MMDNRINKDVPESFRHEEIHEAIYELETFCNEVNQYGIGPKFEELSLKLSQFRSILANHFIEEQLFLLALIKRGAQISQAQYGQILEEHTVILERLADVLERLESGNHRSRNWSTVWDEFNDIIDRIAEHEAEEQDLIAKAVDFQNRQVSPH
ncbi:hypothetical protein [uncultured Rubinisphaera sp.]|uniref:hypothetical protein n=2 Tax=Rubinisphaera TaxID=1649490 RepID=UPI0030D88856|tara:strand:- start:1327 stop:1785 length:459 start_codon:yes stop_codon:yes gene_type:complete